MKNKKRKWKILLVLGIMPFVIALIYGVYSALTGFSGLCFWMCKEEYGLNAFFESIYLFSYILWPIYVIGLILIILSIYKLKK